MYIVIDLWLIATFFMPLTALITTTWIFSAFGAMTVLPPEFAGGINLPVTTFAFLAVIMRVLREAMRGHVQSLVVSLGGLGLISSYTAVAVTGALILPRLMGHILVYPMNGSALGGTEYVIPTTANITQALYIVISSGTAVAFALIAARDDVLGTLRIGFFAGAATLVATGILDMVFAAAGQSDLLNVFRLAQYAYLVDVEVVNVRRVVGLMPEASAFGGTCVFWCGTLLFTRGCFPPRQRYYIVGPLIIATAVFAVLSTSTTAYFGLGVTGLVFGLNTLWRMATGLPRDRLRAATEFAVAILLTIATATYVLLTPALADAAWSVFDSVVLDKSNSSSFEERGAWTAAGLDAFWSSLGLGVGVGSVRTSNMFVNILASTGLLGACLFGGFLIFFFTARSIRRDEATLALVGGLKLAALPTFAAAAVAGTTPDFGPFLGAGFGLVVGASFHHRSTRRARAGRLRRQAIGSHR